MKKVFVFGMLLLLSSGFFSACKDMKGGKMLPVSGAANELLVVMPEKQWEGAMGDSIRQFFGQEVVGLPQKEPMFDLISIPPANFKRNMRTYRSIFIVSVKNSVDSAIFNHYDSPWANTQKIFKITAPNEEAFYHLFDANKEKMLSVYLRAERERLIDVHRKTVDSEIFEYFKNKYNLLLYVPGEYVINKKMNDFVWMSAETSQNSRGIIFYEEPYTDPSQFNYHIILDRMNEELKKYIPASLDSSWMALDLNIPMTVAQYEYDGKHYAMLVKGLWTAVNDFMAGPFVLNVVLDQERQRVIYMMGYVYAPEEEKRNKLRQVESILFSMQFANPEEEKKGSNAKM